MDKRTNKILIFEEDGEKFAKIPLNNGEYTLLDIGDAIDLCACNWTISRRDSEGYACARVNGRMTFMHRLILDNPDGEVIHLNYDKLDNRRRNLFAATKRQQRQHARIDKISQYPGVTWRKDRNLWVARIVINGERKYLGSSRDEYEAFKLYKEACKQIGEEVIE